MELLTTIRKCIEEEMQLFEKTFADTFTTESEILLGVMDYVLQKNGSYFRPMIVLLCAKMCGGINQTTIDGALALDLLHTARIIHEDVIDVDTSDTEQVSLNTRWTNKIATLSGDYILSKSLSAAIKTNNMAILRAVSTIGMQLSDAELSQLETSMELCSNVDEYLLFARKRTASLFAHCAEVGGISVDANKIVLTQLSAFGEYLGICFQLKNDIDNKWADNNFRIAKDQQLLSEYKNKAVEALNCFEHCEAKMELLQCLEYATILNS